MKKVKLILVATIAILFLGISNVNAQEKSTVLIKARVIGEYAYVINTVKPDYTTYELKNQTKDENALVALKRELDKWISEGYIPVNSTVSGSFSPTNETIYILIKE